ncbi:ABC transporter ATP-binding protein [Microbacterium sp. No. 7]|uniref:ABC transporter ATP-binding protein n=1 Tax=Microbacterium sp. No. 7 TaxID=1714373 RepID=UPI0006ECE4DB|nr:ABC transporter ATP-binding protein [Microbacterium sp. No. 7]ALJ19792.1 ABC transporter permease [Microbacterium sp. No. 7]
MTLTPLDEKTSPLGDAPAGERLTVGAVVSRHRRGLILSAVFAIVAGVCSLAPYVAVYAVTVALFDPDGGGADAIGWIAGATAAAIVVRAVASGLSTHAGHVAAYRVLADLRRAIARTLQRLPLGRVQARSAGEMKKLLHDDVEQLEEALAHGVPDMAAAAAVPVATTALLFAVDWRLALVALGSLALLVLVSAVGVRAAMPGNRLLAAHTSVLNRAVLGYLQGIKVIRGFLRPDSGYDQARDAIVASGELSARVTAGPLRWLVATMSAATGLAVALLIPVAGVWFADGAIGLPTLALFLLVGLAYLSPVIGLVGTIATIMARIQFSAGSIREILAEPVLPEPVRPREPERFDVAFDRVSFAYGEDAGPVLSDLTLRIPEGARFALVGPTGAGKSTVARLVARFWDVAAGAVSIGGVDVRDIPQAALARLVAFVQQDEYLFAASLRENIRIARPGATDAEVEAAGRAAQLDELAADLPHGWDTELPGGGGTLSGGQRQRVSIARALLKDAPVIVLDEATASLDAETERATLAAIAELTAGRTVIAIAHRLATIRSAERIAFLERGVLEAEGTHDELLAASDGYARLWAAYTSATGWHLDRDAGAPLVPIPGPAPHPAAVDERDAAARAIVTPGLGALGFGRQWIRLLGRGRPALLRRGLPRLLLEGLVRGIPLVAVFLILNAAIAFVSGGAALEARLVWIVTGILVAGLVLRLLVAQWANRTVWSIAAASKTDLQLSVVERLRRVPLGFFSRIDNGRVTTLIGNDIVMIDFQNVPQQIAGALVQPIYVTIALLVIDARLALAALIGLPVFWAITALSDRVYHRVFTDVHAARREATTILLEQARGAAVLRGNPASFIASRFEHAVARLERASVDMSVRATPAIGLGAIAIESGLVALIVAGGALYAGGAVPATTLLLFLLLSLTLYQPIQELGVLAGYRHNQEQIAQKIAEVWDAPVLPEPARPATPADASVEFCDVTFGYDDADDADGRGPVLRGVSFRVEPGAIAALVGPSGSGKSTIANLAARLWDPDAGSVRIGGRDLRDLGTDTVMRMVTTVYQDVYLFHDTIRFNVAIGRPGATDDEVWGALAAAQIDDEVRVLPNGLDTVVDDGGTNLSGGQRQRISIARALLKDAPIVILDEAVASVDPDTEARIQDAIGRLAAGRTVLVVAHRLDTVRDVDQILTVAGGTVAGAVPR